MNLEGIDSEGSDDEEEPTEQDNDADMFAEGEAKKAQKKSLNKNEIEGQEWNNEIQEEEKVKVTPFNMDQEMEEGCDLNSIRAIKCVENSTRTVITFARRMRRVCTILGCRASRTMR